MTQTYRIFLDQLPTPAWLTDAAGRLVEVNSLFEVVCGGAGTRLGRPLLEAFEGLLHPAEADRFHEAWTRSARLKRPLDVGHRFYDAQADGFFRSVSRARPLQGPLLPGATASDGRSTVGGFLGTTVRVEPAGVEARVPEPDSDPTRKRAQYHSLPLRVADVETLLDVIPIAIGIFDAIPPQRLVMNPACSAMLGLGDLRSIDLSRPENLPFSLRLVGRMTAEMALVGDVFRLDAQVNDRELEVVRRDGSSVKLLQFMAPLLDEGTTPRGAVAAFIDITDRKAHEEQMAQARELAEQANRAKDRFIAMLSHELRTPLTPVLAALAELRAEVDLPDHAANALTMVERNVELEARLIEDLLDLTKISRGKLKLQREVCDLHPLVRGVAEMLAADVEAANLSLNLHLDAARTHTRCDPARVQQVLWNLIKNAVKFTPAGGTIDVVTSNFDGEWLRVEVRDTGVGIDADTLPRIFFAFEQAETAGPGAGGLGLGLTISKVLIDMHGGRLKANSAGSGKGATFTVELELSPAVGPVAPEAKPNSAQKTPASATGRAQKEARQTSGRRLLFVDDHPDTCRAMRRLLSRLGFDVTVASSVQEAIDAFEADPGFDLLISDIGLPDGTGVDLIQILQAKRPIAGIALSGFGMEEDVRRSRQAGFSEHLIKPISIQKLEAAIQRLTSPAASKT